MTSTPKNMPLVARGDTLALGCLNCAFLGNCGGLYVKEAVWDCFSNCGPDCSNGKCDYTCPCKSDFISKCNEVGGLTVTLKRKLLAPSIDNMPAYIPMIYHGKRRKMPLESPMVALSLYNVLGKQRKGYGIKFQDAETLRRSFCLHENTRILLVSVGYDCLLEDYWAYRRYLDLPSQLAQLDFVGVTAPNFSFFLDAPRTHVLWNRRRILTVAEELSRNGIGVILHLNASSRNDWDFWARLLGEQRNIRYISKEFCTGLSRLEAGRRAIEDLSKLQDTVGYQLHPIAIGAARFIPDLKRHFGNFTIVDSVPFMRTVKRREFVKRSGRHPAWIKHTTERDEPLDALLAHNINSYQNWLLSRMAVNECEQQQSEHDEESYERHADYISEGGQLLLPHMGIRPATVVR
ncbi:MAG TPA: DUF4417 domain-containing protein [Chthonomonadaceae bacterium]|nr:DUF4417 domain-containing protein [Chthonomonadaceae bacterium]